ncbi:hypothetical protein SJI19_07655 [Acerihabitans sp. TG2]|nr:hypothetical protein [Acerihabitans sp. TG2]MEA9390418.1 hypothetical protein [Acerihabitans sp. TG2]
MDLVRASVNWREQDYRNMDQTRCIFLDKLAEKYAAMPLNRD